ncbi:MAG TPA: glutamine-hydrolyzing carbamoyl-phosphate synthase small subunit [Thermodesulfobacteriota bacterium]|nr:glutamine-hydrolyzing carbamoyl-phosphate synthase small subunit [Thermodesulfobacteriota bacterium]
MSKAVLLLEDGTHFFGRAFGSKGEVFGEIVFNTSLTGYQEILTDPSYSEQIIVMTYPEIGNYGINDVDVESSKPHAKGFVVKEFWKTPSNWRSQGGLGTYLKDHGIVGIEWIDTRAITRKIRNDGAQKCVISSVDLDIYSLKKKVHAYPSITGRDIVSPVTCEKAYQWNEGTDDWNPKPDSIKTAGKHNVVVYDFGVKKNILRRLVDLGCDVSVVPSTTSPEDILSMNPDGILLSNGPGDPFPVEYAAENVKSLIGKKPIFGICLGHQVLSLALGAKTFKLKFGHRGGNQPVKNLRTGEVEITSQNHGFAVAADSFGKDIEITHINLNDDTVEGIEHKKHPAFSVQYHPEASPGPHDASYLFDKFIELMS